MKVLDHPDKESIRVRGRQYAATFQWENTAKQVLDTYQRAVSS